MLGEESLNKISSFPNLKILVIGDIMLDHYIYGEVTRISPEAPVPILKKTHEKYVPGGAANVAYNLAALGAKVSLAGYVGEDHMFNILEQMLKKQGVDINGVEIEKNRNTIIKEKFLAKSTHLLRLDTEETSPREKDAEDKFFNKLKKYIDECDGVIFSDYAKGCFSQEIAEKLIKYAKVMKKPIFADIKPVNKEFFKGVDVITPNLKEALEMSGANDVYTAGSSLRKFYKTDVVVTRSHDGITLFKNDGGIIDIPVQPTTVIDVSGAGDSAIAVQALCVLSGMSIEDACFVANVAGAIVVQKSGTATLSVEELMSELYENNHIESVDIVPKLWGYEKWLENNEKYCCKLLSLNAGYQCSLHYHKEKDEMFFVTKGHVRLESDGKITHMRAGNFKRIPPGTRHRFSGVEDSVIIEVSTEHKESDSHRIEESKKIE